VIGMKKLVSLAALIISLFSVILYSEGEEKKTSLLKSYEYNSFTHLNINRISTWIYNDGTADININGNSGFEFPKGSGKAAIFQSGFLWGGKVNGQIRVGGSAYRSGLKPGRILNSGVPWNQLQTESFSDPQARIYRVRKHYKTADLSSEIEDSEGTAEEIRTQYEKDWNEWPAEYGAPYDDVDDDGVYNPLVDIPGVPGAEQTAWYAANDVDSNKTKFLYGSLPLGIEMQVTIWEYRTNKTLDNIIFKKYTLINKGDYEITNMYTSIWNDPDLGDATDDYVGCDTLLDLGFVYNAYAFDEIYGNYPPSVGIKLLQGPIVDGIPSDSAIFNGQVIYGKKNLPMTAHYFIISPDAIYRDPIQGQYIGTLEFYNLFQGRSAATGELFQIPPQLGGGTTTFPLSGDPVSGEGFIDGILHSPGDRRNGISSGPFNMASGDIQEIVFAQIAAGAADNMNHLEAISYLKTIAEFSQFFYESFYSFPFTPHSPEPIVGEFDREIILNWGNDTHSMQAIENFDFAGYKFQGYNIYQLPSKEATFKEAILLATFDIKDGVTVILDDEIDPETGLIVRRVQQIGSDSGLERFITIKKDFIKNEPLNNGSVYYFAVTAYTYNPALLGPNNFESSLKIVRAVPQSTPPGIRYGGEFGEKIEVVHDFGESDGVVDAEIIDPSILTGDSYQITIDFYDDETIWYLTDISKGTEKLNKKVKFVEDGEYVIIDGIKIFVANQRYGIKQGDIFNSPENPDLWGWEIISGNKLITDLNANGFSFEGFRGAIGYANPYSYFNNKPNPVSPFELKNVLIKFGRVPDGTIQFENPYINPNVPSPDENFSYAYRYGIGFENSPAKTEFIPYIINPDSGFSFQDFKKSVPLSAWDIDDPANPRRLAVGFTENNSVNGLLDGRYWPGNWNNYNNTSVNGSREWLFIFNSDYSETSNPDLQVDILSQPVSIMYWFTVNRVVNAPFSPGESGDDQMTLHPNKIFTEEDVYSFTAPGIIESSELAKEDVKKINVFPNPYYGSSPQEASTNETFVTFNHLPNRAVIRIFNLAGQLVRTIDKNSVEQFEIWDLRTDYGMPAASGIFIIYIEMPDLQQTKILKLAIVQRQILPEFY
jgi:hypothetical protein